MTAIPLYGYCSRLTEEWPQMTPRELKTIRRDAVKALRAAGIPERVTLADLLQLVSAHNGRKIKLRSLPPNDSISAIFLRPIDGDHDILAYREDTGLRRRRQLIGHELGHVLLGHIASEGARSTMDLDQITVSDLQALRRCLRYDARAEMEAEVAGHELSERLIDFNPKRDQIGTQLAVALASV